MNGTACHCLWAQYLFHHPSSKNHACPSLVFFPRASWTDVFIHFQCFDFCWPKEPVQNRSKRLNQAVGLHFRLVSWQTVNSRPVSGHISWFCRNCGTTIFQKSNIVKTLQWLWWLLRQNYRVDMWSSSYHVSTQLHEICLCFTKQTGRFDEQTSCLF